MKLGHASGGMLEVGTSGSMSGMGNEALAIGRKHVLFATCHIEGVST
jgi:hypothetical protein